MINFQVRFDETIGRWQFQHRDGHWSVPSRMPKLIALLQSELTSFEEASVAKTASHPSTNPKTYNRSPLTEFQEEIAWMIKEGKVVKCPPAKGSPKLTRDEASQAAELLALLELDL